MISIKFIRDNIELIKESLASRNSNIDLDDRDELTFDAAKLVIQHQQASVSLLQRKFRIGYSRAGRIIDELEAAGIVGPFEGSKARQVLVKDELGLEEVFNQLNNKD